MDNRLKSIDQLIRDGHIHIALEQLNQLTDLPGVNKADTYYLMGNVCRKQGDWQGALNNYQEAVNLDAESPAAEARKMIMDILEFYNKDMYNQ